MYPTRDDPATYDQSYSQYFLRQGYRVRPARSSSRGHWQGGKPRHKNAVCPQCKRPLLLLWDLNCRDPRLMREVAHIFGSQERLPLYYCWRCSITMSYQVVNGNRIKIHKVIPHHESNPDDFPYEDYPEIFPRQPIVLEPIPYEIENLLLLLQEAGDDWLKPREMKRIAGWLGSDSVRGESDAWRHQLGGLPYFIQGPMQLKCENKRCPRSKPDDGGYVFWLKPLAVIHNDPMAGLPMIETKEQVIANNERFRRKRLKESKMLADFWTQVIYYICNRCLTIYVTNACD